MDALVLEREDIASPKIRGDNNAMVVLFVFVLPAWVVVIIWEIMEAYSTAATTIFGKRTKSPTSDEARIAWISTISRISFTESIDVESHILFSNGDGGDDDNDESATVSSRRK